MPRAPHAEVRHVKGVSLATKMTALISLVVAVFMVIFSLVLVRFVEDTAKDQILRAAVDAARTAAQADLPAWTAYFATVDQGLTKDEVQARVATMNPFDYRMYDQDVERRTQMEWNRERLSRVLGTGTRILAMELFRVENGLRSALLASSYEGGMQFAPVRGAAPVLMGAGEAQEGLFTIAADTRHVIRGSYPIVDPEGEQTGEVAVYIHADSIAQATADFHWKVAYAALVFIMVGAALAFFLGTRITRPLRQLQDDIRAVASGDLQHHTRPHSSDEIGQLARTLNEMTHSLASARDAERAAAASRHQLAVAAEVTGSLFPDTLPELSGWDVAGLHDESGEPGGATYDVLPMPGGQWGFLVAGTSGGGVPAALVVAMARASLRAVAEGEADPGRVLRRVNALLSPDLREGLYVTALLAVLDPAAGRVRLANAGHAPLLHHHASGGGLAAVLSEGIALGFDEGPVFDQTLKVAEVAMAPGDRAILYAPAVAALAGADGQALGEKRFQGLVKREAGHDARTFATRVGATLRKFHGGEALGPEVTLLSFGRRP